MSDQSKPPGSTPYTRDEIRWSTERYNPTAAKLLLDQSILALQDLLDAKKQFETKAIALLAGFFTTTAFLLGNVLANRQEFAFEWVFIVAGGFTALGAISAFSSLGDKDYGSAGVDAQEWLCPRHLLELALGEDESVKGDQSKYARLAALLAHDTGYQIKKTRDANKGKATLISAAIWIGGFGVVIAVGGAFLELTVPR